MEKVLRTNLTSPVSPLANNIENNENQGIELSDSPFPTKNNKDLVEEKDEDYIIKLENIHKTYLLGVEGVPALRGIDLTVKKGEWIVLYGTSGGGKTSLLNTIGTIDMPTKGMYIILTTLEHYHHHKN